MSLFTELKRRSVFRVAVGYLAGSWLLIQVLETLLPIFGISETTARVVVIILAIGFLPTLILAWFFEITPEGFVRDSGKPPVVGKSRRFDRAVVAVLAVALTYFALDKFVLDPARDAALVEQVRQEATSASGSDLSIAVLPFADLSPGGNQQYFSDGISEEMINLLAGVPGLRVTSRSSAFTFRGDVDIREVGETLRVGHVLEGSVRTAGNRIRITAQLIDASTDTHLWSQNYDREMDDIFAIQDEIAALVVRELEIRLVHPIRQLSTTSNSEAHRLYLQANHIWNNQVATSYSLAETLVEEALELDPNFVPAITLLARIYYVQQGRDMRPADEDTRQLIRNNISRAEQLDPNHPEVLAWKAFIIRNFDGRLADSIPWFRRAIAANPSNDLNLLLFANLARNSGHLEEAIGLYNFLIARSPLFLRAYRDLQPTYLLAHRYEEVIALADRARSLGIGSNSDSLRKRTATAHLLLDDPEASLDELSGISDIYPGNVQKLHGRALAYYSLGRIEEADTAFEAARDGINDFQKAQVLAWFGRNDEAFERLYAENPGCCNVQFDPLLRGLHDDPRWPELIAYHRVPEFEALDFSLDLIAPLSANP